MCASERRGQRTLSLPSTVRLRLNVNSDLSLSLKYGLGTEGRGKKERRVTTRLETGLRPRLRIQRGPVLEATVYNCDRSPVYGSRGGGRTNPIPMGGREGQPCTILCCFLLFRIAGHGRRLQRPSHAAAGTVILFSLVIMHPTSQFGVSTLESSMQQCS